MAKKKSARATMREVANAVAPSPRRSRFRFNPRHDLPVIFGFIVTMSGVAATFAENWHRINIDAARIGQHDVQINDAKDRLDHHKDEITHLQAATQSIADHW